MRISDLSKVFSFFVIWAVALGACDLRGQTTLKGGVSYSDRASQSCEEENQNNPYTGMNPFVCHGEMAPTDSRGQCSLNIGTVWKKVGNECYYCAPINPPIQGMLVPMDDVGAAESQGWGCGANQTDACTAICWGGRTFTPPPGTVVEGGGPGLPATPRPPQGGPPPGYAPIPGPPPVPGAANPCLPFGPGGYDYCANPKGIRLPAGCVCNQAPPIATRKPVPNPTPPATNPNPGPAQPRNPIVDTGQYLQGMAAGLGVCVQGLGSIMAGAGYFMSGNFVKAQELWGLTPGQSILLKTLYQEMTTKVVGQNISPYEQGLVAGRRICQYALIPEATKGVGGAIKGGLGKGGSTTPPKGGGGPPSSGGGGGPPAEPGTGPGSPNGGGSGGGGGGGPPSGPSEPGGGTTPSGGGSQGGSTGTAPANPGGSTPTEPGTVPTQQTGIPETPAGMGTSAANPYKGGPLQATLDNTPKNLANNWVERPNGPVKVGDYVGNGSFADVYKLGADKVIKLSRNTPNTYGYGPESIKGQVTGAGRLNEVGVETPQVSDFEGGGNGDPASLVADDVTQKYPGSIPLTSKVFQQMPPQTQAAVLNAIKAANDKIAGGGFAWADTNPSNITLRPNGSGFDVVIHDPDMIMNMGEVQSAIGGGTVPGGVLDWGMQMAKQPNFLSQPFSIQSLGEILNQARTNWLYGAKP